MIRIPLRVKRLLAFGLAALLAMPQSALVRAAEKPQKVQLLFVQNSADVAIDAAKGTLRLVGVSPSTLFFTDRPVRMAGHYHTKEEFLKMWNEGPDSFAKNPPNATLSIVEPGKPDLENVVVNLRNPRMQGNDLVYDIKLIEGTLPKAGGAGVLFIDILGFWRRNIRRVAIIGTAAAVATAGAAEASAAAASAAAAQKPQTVNVQVTEKPAATTPQSAAQKKLEQLKALEKEGLISAAQYKKASQEVLNEMIQ